MSKDERTVDLKFLGRILPKTIPLAFKLGGQYVKFRWESRKGGKIFEKELIKQGMDKETAKELTQIYIDGARIPKMG